jgi:hypothetical protein
MEDEKQTFLIQTARSEVNRLIGLQQDIRLTRESHVCLIGKLVGLSLPRMQTFRFPLEQPLTNNDAAIFQTCDQVTLFLDKGFRRRRHMQNAQGSTTERTSWFTNTWYSRGIG